MVADDDEQFSYEFSCRGELMTPAFDVWTYSSPSEFLWKSREIVRKDSALYVYISRKHFERGHSWYMFLNQDCRVVWTRMFYDMKVIA